LSSGLDQGFADFNRDA